MKFIITIDTEADNQWKQQGSVSLRNLAYLPRFHELCKEFGFKPTYLITYEVTQDMSSASWFRTLVQNGEAEVGTHLHPWTTPPFRSEEEKKEQTFPCDLDTEVFVAKLRVLHNAIIENIGMTPTSFRAGRWGISNHMLSYLRENGYMVDSSITPFINWSTLVKNGSHKMDFRHARLEPYILDEKDMFQRGDSGMVEVPMSIYAIPRFGIGIWKYTRNPLHKIEQILNKMFYKITWCRIFPDTDARDLIACYKQAKKEQVPVLQFMIHSSELMPGGSIYNTDDASIDAVYEKLHTFFQYMKTQHVQSVTLTEYAKDVLDSQKQNK